MERAYRQTSLASPPPKSNLFGGKIIARRGFSSLICWYIQNKNALSDIQTNSGITLYDSGKHFDEIVAFAKEADADTKFDTYMSKLNTKWVAAIK